MEAFKQNYGFYPKYPIADAGYGSYNNYIYCEQHGMEKYMKFPMYKKETKDYNYHNDPFRTVNFRIDQEGILRCPNGRAFHFQYRKNVYGNKYGRQEEVYHFNNNRYKNRAVKKLNIFSRPLFYISVVRCQPT